MALKTEDYSMLYRLGIALVRNQVTPDEVAAHILMGSNPDESATIRYEIYEGARNYATSQTHLDQFWLRVNAAISEYTRQNGLR